uniref:Uncharacterized protein n=1 Tax=Acrobeloides nanus TaxID=290746 RepID=A0A914D4P4_9BILA
MSIPTNEDGLKSLIPTEAYAKLTSLQKQSNKSGTEKKQEVNAILQGLPQDVRNKLELTKQGCKLCYRFWCLDLC